VFEADISDISVDDKIIIENQKGTDRSQRNFYMNFHLRDGLRWN